MLIQETLLVFYWLDNTHWDKPIFPYIWSEIRYESILVVFKRIEMVTEHFYYWLDRGLKGRQAPSFVQYWTNCLYSAHPYYKISEIQVSEIFVFE